VADKSGEIISANEAARQLLHLPQDEQIHIKLPEVIQQKLTAWQQNTFATSAPFRMDQKGIQIQVGFSYLDPQERTETLIFLEDYSRLLGRAQQIKLVSLGRLTASIAHEIRNPLGAISHASQLLNESDSLHEDDARLIEIIQNHSKRVNYIITNILELSRAQKSLVPELIDIEGWLPEFIDTFRSTSGDPVEIDLSIAKTDLRIRFSLSQLDQVMTNLCENGFNHSKNSNTPKLTIIAGFSSSSQRPYLDIIDEGPGVKTEDEERVFEPFYTTEKGGTGLGLYISREICEAHQAELSFRRTDENKSCFRITFSQPDRHLVDIKQIEQV
jgi:two-component system sensor histidine kinase PilS (NtrC family)